MLFKFIVLITFVGLWSDAEENKVKDRQRRYLVFTPFTQYGAFITVSVPLPEPDNLISLAWFYEANYYIVDNSSYYAPLLGDIEVSRSRESRALKQNEFITRSLLYIMIESMLEKHEYSGRSCLLRLICETSTSHYSHNGVLGDLFHLIFTPSSSLEEDDLKDCYYESEYRGLDGECEEYFENCPSSPMDHVSLFIDHIS